MYRIEKTAKRGETVPLLSRRTILLDGPDLAEIGLRVIDYYVKHRGYPDGAFPQGKLSLPHRISPFSPVAGEFKDYALREIIKDGRARIKQGKGSVTVLFTKQDETISQAMGDLGGGILTRIGFFAIHHYPQIRSMTLFPNASPYKGIGYNLKKLNGVLIETEDGIKTRDLAAILDYLNWPFERRLRVIALPIGLDDITDELLGKIRSPRLHGVKFSNICFDKDGRLYLATSIGPSASDKKEFGEILRPSLQRNQLKEAYRVFFTERTAVNTQKALRYFFNLLGLEGKKSGLEGLTNTPYLRLQEKPGGGFFIFSGGTTWSGEGNNEEMKPFTGEGGRKIILYRPPQPESNEVLPIGTRGNPISDLPVKSEGGIILSSL